MRKRDTFLYIIATILFALGIAIGACGAGWYLTNEIASVQFLQGEIVKLHSDLNRSDTARAELMAHLDFVDDSAYRTGWRDSCVAMGRDSEYCQVKAEELAR